MDVVEATSGLQSRELTSGEVLFGQGDENRGALAILVSGTLRIEHDGVVLNRLTVPGAFVGEIAALVEGDRTATVIAEGPAVVRVVGQPEDLFAGHPGLALELARQLAGRLQRLLLYLGDLRSQYAGEDGHLGVLDSVLGKLASRPPVEIEGGSDREPDY